MTREEHDDMPVSRAGEIERIRMWAVEQTGGNCAPNERLQIAAGIVDFIMSGTLPDGEAPTVKYKATLIFDPPARASAQQWKGI